MARRENNDRQGHAALRRPPRLKEVAQAAGVHASTASRALNPETAHLVTPEVVALVKKTASAMGYRVNPLAASLRTNQSRMIGVVMRDFTNTMLPIMFRGIENRLRENGYLPLFGTTYADPERKRDLIDTFLDRRVDGLIITFADPEDEVVEELRERHLPFVLLNRTTRHEDDVRILPDAAPAIRQIVGHLIGLGHREIGYVAGPATALTAEVKIEAFREALQQHGLPFTPDAVVRAHLATDDDGEVAARELIARRPDLTALVCGNDLLALGALRALEASGRSCPADMSVTGFNDMPHMDRMSPPLTTARLPHYEMGAAAAEQVVRLINGDAIEPRLTSFPASMIVRGSTGPRR